jgi:signal transduction histidine kinase/CheY-like chemotaxis protein
LVDRHGRIWVGTTEGAAVLDPRAEAESLPPARLVLEEATVAGVPRDYRSAQARPLDGSPLDHTQNDIVFEYSLHRYFKEHATSYRTQLVGLDRTPSAWVPDGKRTFTNLPPGGYVFEIWARDYRGEVVGPLRVPFAIQPAPWRTWWAYLAYILAVLATGYGLMQVWLSSLRRRNRLLEAGIAERTKQLDAKNRALAEAVAAAQQAERVATDANRAKSVFLASMSHELRTPLNAILGFAQLIQRGSTNPSELREYIDIIARSGEHLLGLINDVLSISKIEAGKVELVPAPFDLRRLLASLHQMLGIRARGKGIELRFHVAEDVPVQVCGDEGKLRQVLLNLLGNALKFTERGEVVLDVTWQRDRASFVVTDSGRGIAEEELDQLFQPFHQTESGRASTEGTGLGLVISRSFVRLMGGDIDVTSTLGKGSTFQFTIDLPGTAETVFEQRRGSVTLAPGERPRTILVVDDVWANRQLLLRFLAPLGCDLREAADGAAAVECYSSWRPEIVFLDMRMPVMDGLEAVRRIRAVEAELGGSRAVVVAVSASVLEQDRDAVLAAGCDAFLPKPLLVEEIFSVLERLAGMRFVYEAPEQAPAAEMELTSDQLASLPESLRERLLLALVEGDIMAVEHIVTEIDEPSLKEAINKLVRAYKLDVLLELLGTAG